MTPEAARDNKNLGWKCKLWDSLPAPSVLMNSPKLKKRGGVMNYIKSRQKSKIGGHFCKICTYDPMSPSSATPAWMWILYCHISILIKINHCFITWIIYLLICNSIHTPFVRILTLPFLDFYMLLIPPRISWHVFNEKIALRIARQLRWVTMDLPPRRISWQYSVHELYFCLNILHSPLSSYVI